MAVILKPAQTGLTAIIEPSDKAFVALCPELDLGAEGDTFERFSQSPNRAVHAPYIRALRLDPTPAGARRLFEA